MASWKLNTLNACPLQSIDENVVCAVSQYTAIVQFHLNLYLFVFFLFAYWFLINNLYNIQITYTFFFANNSFIRSVFIQLD